MVDLVWVNPKKIDLEVINRATRFLIILIPTIFGLIVKPTWRGKCSISSKSDLWWAKMSRIFHICPVSVGLDSQFWQLFIHITGYLDIRKISEMMVFRTFVVPLVIWNGHWKKLVWAGGSGLCKKTQEFKNSRKKLKVKPQN